jgi:hypothetical protein
VVPFVPVQNATMEDCIEIAREFADRLAMELSVPVYMYGEAQEREYRRDLSQIREGEYEALYSKVRATRLSPRQELYSVHETRSENQNGNPILVNIASSHVEWRNTLTYVFSRSDRIPAFLGCYVCRCPKISHCIQYQCPGHQGASASYRIECS